MKSFLKENGVKMVWKINLSCNKNCDIAEVAHSSTNFTECVWYVINVAFLLFGNFIFLTSFLYIYIFKGSFYLLCETACFIKYNKTIFEERKDDIL